ncbi:alanine--tRNA ligase [bacterium]|nr:alanine--tRNA ligase [bacterium]
MTSKELRKRFLNFFKQRGHKIIPSSSLIPLSSTVLFTSAGMQQLLPYLSGEKDVVKDFGTRHLASYQKCLRTGDIELIGDDTHNTFFEMLGNWSIGQDEKGEYFKEKAINYALNFFCDVLGLKRERLWVTVFSGAKNIPPDKESFEIWKKYGILPSHIRSFGMTDNFWGPVTKEGPCGPCTEIHYDRGEEYGCGYPDCGPNCPRCQRFVELWNLVFMEYNKKLKTKNSYNRTIALKQASESFQYEKLPQKNVDTGIGFERLAAVLEGKPSVYETDIFWPIIQEIEKKSPVNYLQQKRVFRILADHLRAIVFLVSEGVVPSNLDRGYVLRRILRRMIRYSTLLLLKGVWYADCLKRIGEYYEGIYPSLLQNEERVITVIENEREQFERTLQKGMKQFKKLIEFKLKNGKPKIIRGEEAFELYETYGFPLELTVQLAQEKNFSVERENFWKTFKEHQEISRRGAEKKFGGHGIEKIQSKEEKIKITKLHTATHLLQAALRKVLGSQVKQQGSDINEERLRFDFSFNRKLTGKELKEVENLVNEKIKENLAVKFDKLPLEEALRSGALAFFREKYPSVVKVYTIFNPETKEVFSKEICAGPHVRTTSQLGHFKILKEQSSERGVRRIRATLE